MPSVLIVLFLVDIYERRRNNVNIVAVSTNQARLLRKLRARNGRSTGLFHWLKDLRTQDAHKKSKKRNPSFDMEYPESAAGSQDH